jgi:ABC-type phosphate transport system substrate-binding protein
MKRIALAAGICAVLSGCGVDIGSSGGSVARTTTTPDETSRAEQAAVSRRAASLPERSSGELAIAGEQQGSLSSNAVDAFRSDQNAIAASYSAVGATEGFARLCRGEIDLVDSARTISRAELAVCNANGLEIRTPIQIASDAIVLATRNESDVGGDCLTVADIASIYRRGSTIENWNQLGFDDLPLKAAGPDQDANAFSNFASQVLGVTSGATLGDLRSDYRDHPSDDAIRRDIIGAADAERVPELVEQDIRRERRTLRSRRRVFVGHAVVRVRERVLREIRAENRRRARRKEAVSNPEALARRNLRRINRAKREAADRARRTFDRRFDALRIARSQELLGRARRNGVVGFVRFSFYEAYEDQLRPLELDPGAERDEAVAAADKRARDQGLTPPQRLPAVDEAGNRIPNCIFPSQLTITTGEYPLSRRILLYTSTRGLQRREVRAFLAYALRNAQSLATSSRLVPITNRLREDQYRFVTGTAISGTEAPLPGEQVAGTSATTTPRAPATSRTTTTTTPRSPSASTSRDRTPSATPANRVPGVSSGVSSNPQETP